MVGVAASMVGVAASKSPPPLSASGAVEASATTSSSSSSPDVPSLHPASTPAMKRTLPNQAVANRMRGAYCTFVTSPGGHADAVCAHTTGRAGNRLPRR
jgi:hypothetical protein